tara:strand:+ start:2733 stop:3221 length:489 start_codon:yes stop_codon:yes gene_type:complete
MTQMNEGLNFEEMQGLVDSTVSIDQYKPKVGEDADTVVVALTVQYEKPASDLSNFIETGISEHLDVEASPAPNENGEYKVFVEFARNEKLYDNISIMLNNINNITSDKGDWKFKAYKLDEPRTFDKERFARDVMLTPETYRARFAPSEAQKIKERIDFLIKY